jgi:GNAT superfamily N-acetyltransferase
VRTRPATANDARFLTLMVREAAYWRPDRAAPALDVVLADHAIAHYVEAWPRPGDGGVVAVDDEGTPIGAAWWRTFTAGDPGYGYVDERTPELSIAVDAVWRGRGVGRSLLVALHDAARAAGVARLSLSVERDNPARRLYERLGYVEVGGSDGAATMVVTLG